MDVRGQGAPQNLSEAQITGFKGLFALGGNAFSTSSAMHPLVKYTITNRTTPQVGDRAIQADGSNRLTLSKRQSPQAAPEKDPFVLLTDVLPARVPSPGVVHFRLKAGLGVKGQLLMR